MTFTSLVTKEIQNGFLFCLSHLFSVLFDCVNQCFPPNLETLVFFFFLLSQLNCQELHKLTALKVWSFGKEDIDTPTEVHI